MRLWNKWKNEKWFPNTIAACSAVILFFILSNISFFGAIISGIWKVILPIVLGFVFAYIMDPIARFIEKLLAKKSTKHKEIKRRVAVILAALFVVLVIGLLFTAVIPPLFESASGLISIIGNSWVSFEEKFIRHFGLRGSALSFENLNNLIQSFVANASTSQESGVNNILATSFDVGSGVISAILGFILAIYFMFDKERLQVIFKKLLRKMLREERYVPFSEFCYKCDKILLRYIAGDLLDSVIVGVANAIFMAICRLPYIALISVIVGVTNLAPTFGPIFGAIIGAILLLLINPWYALWFLIFTLIIQTIDGYILKPKLFGDTFGISAVLILITIIVGGRLFGAIGILLSIPFAAITQCFIKDYIIHSDSDKSDDK